MIKNFPSLFFLTILSITIMFMINSCHGQSSNSIIQRDLYKRSFTRLGCLGVYDRAKFVRLDRVCEECYQLYREPDLHSLCRESCFRNEIFGRCVDALLQSHEQKKLDEMIQELYGKK